MTFIIGLKVTTAADLERAEDLIGQWSPERWGIESLLVLWVVTHVQRGLQP